MNRTITWVIAAVVLGGAIGVFYYFWNKPDTALIEPETPPAVQIGEDDGLEPQEPIRHPIPGSEESVEPQPLPALNLSDLPVRNALADMYGETTVARYLVPERVIRRIVATVDNLSREKLAVQMRPIKPLGGATAVVGDADLDEVVVLSPENYARYSAVIDIIESTDVSRLADLYLGLYPLFQQAYEELGYPGKYFNDRLVETIDHLLETPEIKDEIRLVRPKVFFEYEDPELERRSAGQKLLIRMGPQNAAVVKAKLRDLREQVTRAAPPQ